MAQKTARIEARLSPAERDQIERAAALAQESVSGFLVKAAVDRAAAVIEETSMSVVPADYFDRLLASIDEPDSASALGRAVDEARRGARIDPE